MKNYLLVLVKTKQKYFPKSPFLFISLSATIVILTAARAGHLVDTLIHTEMGNSSGLIRYNSILRFEILWRFRYQFWIRLEDSAHSMMKVKQKY